MRSSTRPAAISRPTHRLISGDRAGREHASDPAQREDVVEEGGAAQQAQQPDGDVAGRADRLGPLEGGLGVEAVEVLELAGQVDEQDSGGQDHPTLEAAAGGEVSVGDDVDAEQHRQRREAEAEDADGVTGRRHGPPGRVVGDVAGRFSGLWRAG